MLVPDGGLEKPRDDGGGGAGGVAGNGAVSIYCRPFLEKIILCCNGAVDTTLIAHIDFIY